MPGGEEGVGVTGGPLRHRAPDDVELSSGSPLLGGDESGQQEGDRERGRREEARHWRNIGSAALVLGLIGCGGTGAGGGSQSPYPVAKPGTVVPIEQVWILELAGASPADTTVTFESATGRTILMRHGPPDNAIFAIIDIPPDAIAPAGGTEATITIHPTPGRFGFTISSSGQWQGVVQVTFSYAIHFQEPSDAMTRFPSAGRFELALGAARSGPDGTLAFLETRRPAADMLQFGVDQPGTYLLGVPK